MPHDETLPPLLPDDAQEASERFLGLAEDVNFADAIAARIADERPNSNMQAAAILEAHGVDFNPSVVPDALLLDSLEETDWETIRSSDVPLLTLYAAANYHTQERTTVYIPPGKHMLRHEDPRRGHDGIVHRAEMESLPLIHGMTADSFMRLAESGAPMQSNKERYRVSGQDALTFHTDQQGATNLADRELGLDQYVFFDFGRPSAIHREQPEITLVVDQSVMDQPGVFMTEQDVADTSSAVSYMHGLTTPEYFRETALMRIYNTITETGEEGHQGYARYNTMYSWREGQDGDFDTAGDPTFSTYEVKIPSPPGVPQEAIQRVVVRDEATFNHLQETMGDRFAFVYEPRLRPGGGMKSGYQGDPRDLAARDNGSYGEALQVPGLFEQKFAAHIEADYQERVQVLDSLSDEEKEQVVVVFGHTEPEAIDGDSVTTRIDTRTNPYQYGDQYIATYPSMDALRDDVLMSSPRHMSDFQETLAEQALWFYSPLFDEDGIQTPSGTCVIATVERSKSDPNITRIIDARGFSLDELNTANAV